ncbi:MAG: hypothetical protein HOZ81_28190 [Streptomyces sp.]|nr:hypothetical protein [Streptomyces sp.]
MTVLPLGEDFSAIRLPGALVHAAAQSDEPSAVRACLAERLGGPVIRDPAFDRYYALVQTSIDPVRIAPRTEYLGSGTYLGVPRTNRTELDETTRDSYWSVPMARPGALCRVADVLEFTLLCHILTADED